MPLEVVSYNGRMKKKDSILIIARKGKKTVQINLYTDDETKSWLQKKSQGLGYSVSGYIHALIDIDKKKHEKAALKALNDGA